MEILENDPFRELAQFLNMYDCLYGTDGKLKVC